MGVKNVNIADDFESFNAALNVMIDEYKARNKLLYSDELKKATDAKSVRKLYPHLFHLFKPMFLIVDEFGRFAQYNEIQEKVMELVETAGYVNVHVVIATQRPDARTVLRPRIKQGLQARICFRVPDKNNSIVILDEEGAELLPTKEGRAILSDGDKKIIQVPFLDYPECEELLQPYRSEIDVNQSEKRSSDIELSNKISSLFKEPSSQTDIQREQSPGEHHQPSDEKNGNGWFMLEHPKNKR
jgi:DNA segregation ATPase FtsK/SpoIIIE-like protein